MKTVTFAREYRHKLDELRTAIYPADYSGSVSNDVAEAAERAGALKEGEADGVGSDQAD